MRTLFCSHLNDMPLPTAPQQPPGNPGGSAPTACPAPKVSLGRKYLGGELPAGQEGAEPPTPSRTTPMGVPA
ncbi:hypothetical protein [Antarctobacter jejuensis]|uniref:hypothetical protein n=1 Tax=Antarctobacter jejuensis TaxID=1439938 RepID=UPI003FD0F9B2